MGDICNTPLGASDSNNTGHGHVFPRPDGQRAKCGGPKLCIFCKRDQLQVDAVAARTKAPDTEKELVLRILRELEFARANWAPFNSAHEGYAVLLEEVDELWEHVKTNQKKRDLPEMKKEAIQVAAMAMRFALEVCDEERGRK